MRTVIAYVDGRPIWSERFWAKVDRRGPDDCWEWMAGRSQGYGDFHVDGPKVRAHRVAYELLVGPIPDGLDLDHLCRNRGCVNPAHLEPVTRQENLMRSPLTHAGKTHCLRGHPLSGDNISKSKAFKRRCLACHRLRERRRYAA